MIPGFLAVSLGSERLFLFTAPLYLLLIFFYKKAFSKSDFNENFEGKKAFNIKSKYLFCILFLVIFMQMSIALIDYQFNIFLQKNILDMDLRTEYLGKLVSIIHFLTTTIQFLSGFLIIKFLGLRKAHFAIPISLFVNGGIFLFRPTFLMISYFFVYIKSLDFSLFSVGKELLYIPMNTDEKFRAKAVIDVFSHRTSKALAALLILFMQFYGITNFISYIVLILFSLWFFVVKILFQEYSLRLNNPKYQIPSS
jgi:AAA family ATP:ADP antiporter